MVILQERPLLLLQWTTQLLLENSVSAPTGWERRGRSFSWSLIIQFIKNIFLNALNPRNSRSGSRVGGSEFNWSILRWGQIEWRRADTIAEKRLMLIVSLRSRGEEFRKTYFMTSSVRWSSGAMAGLVLVIFGGLSSSQIYAFKWMPPSRPDDQVECGKWSKVRDDWSNQ